MKKTTVVLIVSLCIAISFLALVASSKRKQEIEKQQDRIVVLEKILANPDVGLWPAGVELPKHIKDEE